MLKRTSEHSDYMRIVIWQKDLPVSGLVTLQSPCSVLLRGHAAAVYHIKLYTQSSSAVITVGFESCTQQHICTR